MTVRDLTEAENRQVAGKRKPPGTRPAYLNSGTGEYNQISEDFETLTLLLPVGFRARIGQYLTLSRVASTGPSTMDELRTEFLSSRNRDLQTTTDSYGAIVTAYEDIRSRLQAAASGFEDVPEYQRLLADLAKTVGPYVDDYEALRFQRSVTNVLETRSQAQPAAPGSTSPIQTELQSLVTAMLRYP